MQRENAHSVRQTNGQSGAKADGTVAKALAVLDAVAAAGRPVRFVDLLNDAPFPKATLYRLLQTLLSQGMVQYDAESQRYSLGLRLIRLAHAAWSQSSLGDAARPVLDALSAQTKRTVHLAQLDNAQVLYLDKRNAARPVAMFSDAGRIGPAYCTGVGKAMLAHLPERERADAIAKQSFHEYTPHTLSDPDALRANLEDVARTGVAYDREEHELGIICVAAPVLSRNGVVLGGISFTSSVHRESLADLAALAPLLRNAAAEIAERAESIFAPNVTAGAAE